MENYFPYIYPPRKSTTVWRPLEFPVFGGPNCSAGLGVSGAQAFDSRIWHLEFPDFGGPNCSGGLGIPSIQYRNLGGPNCSAGSRFREPRLHGFGTCFVKDLGFTLKSPGCSFFIFGKRVNSLDFLVLFVVVQIVVTVSGRGMHPRSTYMCRIVCDCNYVKSVFIQTHLYV